MVNAENMKETIIIFVAQVAVVTVIYTGLLYLWGLMSDGTYSFDGSLLVQGLVFSIIYVPLSGWWKRRKKQ